MKNLNFAGTFFESIKESKVPKKTDGQRITNRGKESRMSLKKRALPVRCFLDTASVKVYCFMEGG